MDKNEVRQAVFEKLRKGVARPDSRFDMDLGEFIADFVGSGQALCRLIRSDFWRQADTVFITPDNCLERLRYLALWQEKTIIVSTYGIRRGFVLLGPGIPKSRYLYAATLDGMENEGAIISLQSIKSIFGKIDLLVTGTGAVTIGGIRIGKGHGYFDLEWAMFYSIGVVSAKTPVVAVVHDCQVVTEQFSADPFDTACDLICTPRRMIKVDEPHKPTLGVVWDSLQPGMLGSIPPLRELQAMQEEVVGMPTRLSSQL